MGTNDTNKETKLIYPELSYLVTGICFAVHNEIGRYCLEKKYADDLERKFKEIGLNAVREYIIPGTRNAVDFLIDDKIVLEIKAKKLIEKDDYYQTQRYLQLLNKRLALLINFRNRYLKPARIVKIDTTAKQRFT